MTTQYTPILKLALPVTGELSGTWGDVVNDNITSMVEQAIAGLATINTWTTNSHTLTTANGLSSESRCAMLVAQDGAGLSAAGEIICPAATKLYILKNSTSYTITLKTAAGSGVAVPSGQTTFLFCDGTNVAACVTTVSGGGPATFSSITNTGLTSGRVVYSTAGGLETDSANLTFDGTTLTAAGLATTGALQVDGNSTLGNASTDTVTISGRLGFGTAAATSTGIYYRATAAAITGATTGYGVLMDTPFASDVTGAAIGVYSRVNTAAAAYTTTNTYSFRAANTVLGAGSTVTTQAGLYVDDLTSATNNYAIQTVVSSGANKWNIYASGTANNAFAGSVRVGSTVAPAYTLDVTGTFHASGNSILGDASTDTVTVNGYMAVGATPTASQGLRVVPSALTGTTQFGAVLSLTATSAATSGVEAARVQAATAAVSFTTGYAAGLFVRDAILGSGSTITNNYGVYVDDKTVGTNNYGITSLVSSGSNKWNIYASGTAANYFAGNVLLQTTTVAASTPGRLTLDTGANAGIDIFRSSSTANFIGIRFRDTTNANTYASIGWDATSLRLNGDGGNVLLLTGGTERMRIDSSGNVGIGTTAPGSELEVLSTDSATAIRVTSGAASTTTGTSTLRLQSFNSASGVIGSAEISNTAPAGGQSILTFSTSPSGNAPTERMRLSAAGGLSIGDTTDPGAGGLRATGNVTLGDASTDTVTVNGYMGVGGAANSAIGLFSRGTALTGTIQIGVQSNPTGTSDATVAVRGYASAPATAAASFTVSDVVAFNANNAVKGAGSTITNQHGVRIEDQTQGTNNYGITSAVSSGSNKWNIYASGTAANYLAGALLIGTTASQSLSSANVIGNLQIETANSFANATIVRNTANVNGPILAFGKSRGAALGSRTAVNSGDSLGEIRFDGADGTSMLDAAYIYAQADAAFTTGSAPGRLLFATTASGGATPTERMRIDSSGNVGIGTTTPSNVLTVAANASTPAAFLRTSSTVSLATYLALQAYNSSSAAATYASVGSVIEVNTAGAHSGALSFNTTSAGAITERMRIDSSGNVGIGTSSPSTYSNTGQILAVVSTAPSLSSGGIVNYDLQAAAADVGGVITLGGQDGTVANRAFAAFKGGKENATSGNYASYASFATRANGGVMTERMRIDSSGNVGIGTSSPTYRLEVGGTASGTNNVVVVGPPSAASGYSGLIQFRDDTAARRWAVGILHQTSATALSFYDIVAASERMRIDSSGNLGLGVTPSAWTTYKVLQIGSQTAIANTGAFSVYGTNWYYDGADKYVTTGNATQYYQNAGQHIWRTAPSGTINTAITFTQAMTLDASGRLLIGTTASRTNVVSSGSRLQIEDISSGASPAFVRNSADTIASYVVLGKSRGTTVGSFTAVTSGDQVGGVSFEGADGTALVEAARVQGFVDGTVSAGVVPGRLAFYTASSAGSLIERMRIDSAGNVQTLTGSQVVWAPTPASINTTATLTNANIQGQIINTTGTSYTVTMPLGTTLETLVSWAAVDLGYDFSVINTASGTITMAANTGVTTLGALTIATGTSARFRIRRTAANTFVLYRMS